MNPADKSKADSKFGQYFSNIEPYSPEHITDIEKFSRLLEELQKSQKSSEDRKALSEIGLKVRDLNDFLLKQDMVLTEREKKQISAITGSHVAPVVAKRMIEDLIYKIRQRIEREILELKEKESFELEIKELQPSGIRIIDWFRVMLYALEYGTLTLFTHHLRGSLLSLLQTKSFVLADKILKNVAPILDTKYYILSILEYNALELFVHIAESLGEIKDIPYRESFTSDEVGSSLKSFSILYITLLKNASIAEAALVKAFKKEKAPHGFWGDFYEFLGRPIFRNKPMKLSYFDRITGTIEGVLLSYFTSQEGVVVRTINQVMFLCDIDGVLDGDKKRLTRAAIADMEETRRDHENHGHDEQKRYEELEKVINNHIPRGRELSERILMQIFKSPVSQWRQECERRPMLYIRRLIEGYIRFFVEPVIDNRITLVYDTKEYASYFTSKPLVYNALKTIDMAEFNLVGSKDKDFTALQLPEETNTKDFIFSLTRADLQKSSLDSRIILARTILQKISNSCYHGALAISEYINRYYLSIKNIKSDVTENYDFFYNAVIKKQGNLTIFSLLRKEEVTLRDFLESACAILFDIAVYLNNTGMDAIADEWNALKEKRELLNVKGFHKEGDAAHEHDVSTDDDISKEIDAIYRDSLTGLWNYQYFTDQVLPRHYDREGHYHNDNNRFIIVCEVDSFEKVNELWGHDMGDRVLLEVSQIIRDYIYGTDTYSEDIILRYKGSMILAYVSRSSLTMVVDVLSAIRKKVNSLVIEDNTGKDIGHILLNAAVYQERRGTDYQTNIQIVMEIMKVANRFQNNMIGFTTDQYKVISSREFDSGSIINENILTVV